jgi:hypothetical protein
MTWTTKFGPAAALYPAKSPLPPDFIFVFSTMPRPNKPNGRFLSTASKGGLLLRAVLANIGSQIQPL